MDNYQLRPAKKILLSEKEALKTESHNFSDDFDTCLGEVVGDTYVVKFENGSDSWKKIYFKKDFQKIFLAFKNHWIKSPILNVSGLAACIWNPDVEGKKKNDIRRRLETKAEWATLTEEEKLIILNQVTDFYMDVKEAMKY